MSGFRDRLEHVVNQTLENGGGTWSAELIPFRPTEGFQIAVADEETVLVQDFDFKTLFSYLDRNPIGRDYLGTWVDEGEVYMEQSMHFPGSLREAIEIGRQHRQKAIWDWKIMDSIPVLPETPIDAPLSPQEPSGAPAGTDLGKDPGSGVEELRTAHSAEETLSPEQIAEIERRAWLDTPDWDDWCTNASYRVSDYLTELGIPHEIESAGDDPEDEVGPNWPYGTHTFIRLGDGTVIDPTLTQFMGEGHSSWKNSPSTEKTGIFPPDHPMAAKYERR